MNGELGLIKDDLALIKAKLGIDRCGAGQCYSGGLLARCELPSGHDGRHGGIDKWGMHTSWLPDKDGQ